MKLFSWYSCKDGCRSRIPKCLLHECEHNVSLVAAREPKFCRLKSVRETLLLFESRRVRFGQKDIYDRILKGLQE